MRTLPASVSIAPAAPIPPTALPKPSILWPSVGYTASGSRMIATDLDRFPPPDSIHQRHSEIQASSDGRGGALLCSEAFVGAAHAAQVRVWILDPKFGPTDRAIVDAIAEGVVAADVRILSENESPAKRREIEGIVDDAAKIANGRKNRPPPSLVKIEWRARLYKDTYPFLHDRFAILDDELWHFGATVGGGHQQLNAFSRGWNARTTNAADFFGTVWKSLEHPRDRA